MRFWHTAPEPSLFDCLQSQTILLGNSICRLEGFSELKNILRRLYRQKGKAFEDSSAFEDQLVSVGVSGNGILPTIVELRPA